MNDKIRRLIYRTVDETVSPAEFEQLQETIRNDDEARDEYLKVVAMSQALTNLSTVESMEKSIAYAPVELRSPGQDSVTKGAGFLGLSGGGRQLAVILTLAASILLVVSLRHATQLQETGTLLEQRVKLGDGLQGQVREASTNYIARITKISPGVVWGKGASESEFLLRTVEGDSIDVRQGLVELEYYSAAKIILHGPCVFVTSGANSGRLEEGRITGRVDGDRFHLMTPTATVIDLGTELGVSLSETAETNVHVFDGEVEVRSEHSGDGATSSVSLTQGMSARVDRHGAIEHAELENTGSYIREFPSDPHSDPSLISLVDVFCATSPNHVNLSGVIAPDSGEPDRRPWLDEDGPGHRYSAGLQVTAWHPFIDSVFIPWNDGVDLDIDSMSNRVDLPESQGRTWGPIWARRKINGSNLNYRVEDFWGTLTLDVVMERLSKSEIGMIGMHANVGFSVDLREVRQLGGTPRQFSGIVANLDNSKIKDADATEWLNANRFSADFRVFVDGKLRASRLDFTRADGELELSVDLQPTDRFLTLISTDADSFDGFDHVVLIDPVLRLDL
ncbi:hypothetical protein [Aporhodopirellula aestuarii]|uniref:FecR protein n=1 Tax=Aporhodopirellula aestuarii TaxID=2950107 RepID=A0ABT0UD08_9BACT|nr:hypothetical protein [Aporhodopirellula aestuarii]MCM2374914.1 hypothetical protein [Aporhodopirellula aestuarii]